jgi:hypothetical protein
MVGQAGLSASHDAAPPFEGSLFVADDSRHHLRSVRRNEGARKRRVSNTGRRWCRSVKPYHPSKKPFACDLFSSPSCMWGSLVVSCFTSTEEVPVLPVPLAISSFIRYTEANHLAMGYTAALESHEWHLAVF